MTRNCVLGNSFIDNDCLSVISLHFRVSLDLQGGGSKLKILYLLPRNYFKGLKLKPAGCCVLEGRNDEARHGRSSFSMCIFT